MLKIHASIWAIVVLAACTVRDPAGSITLGPDPAVAGGTFSSSGGISVAVDVVNIAGKTGICGVWAESVQQSVLTRGRAQYTLGPSAVVLGQEALLTGLQFLRKVPPARDYAGAQADCAVIKRPWQDSDAAKPIQIVIPRQVVYRDLDGTSAVTVTLRPGGPSAHPDDPKPWQTARPGTSN